MSFVKNSFIMIGLGAITRAFGFMLTAVLSRLFGPVDFGLYSLVNNTASSVYGVVRLGTDTSLAVFSSRLSETDAARNLKGDVLGAGFLLFVISAFLGALACILLSAQIAEEIFKQPTFKSWISVASAFVMLQCLSQFLYCVVVGFQLFKEYSKAMVINGAIGLVVTATAAFLYGTAGALLALAATQCVGLAMVYRVVGKALKFNQVKLRLNGFFANAKNILSYGFPFYLSGLAMIPGVYFAQGLLARYGGTAELGGQRIVAALVTLVSFVPNAIAPVMLHRLSSTASGLQGDFASATQRLLKYLWILSVVSSLIAALLTPFIVTLIFGEEFIQFIPAVYLAIFSSSLATVLGVVSNAAIASGRVRLILYYTVLQAVVFTAIAALWIPTEGLKAFFLAETLGHCAIFIYLSIILKGKMVAIYRQGWFLPWIIISALFAVVMMSMMVTDGVNRLLIGFIGLLVSCITIFNYVLERDEKSRLILLVSFAFKRYN